MHSSWSIFKINNPPSRHTDLMTTVIWFPPRSISPMINRIARIWNPPADRRATASSSSRDLETNRMQFGANCCILFHCWGAMTWQKKKKTNEKVPLTEYGKRPVAGLQGFRPYTMTMEKVRKWGGDGGLDAKKRGTNRNLCIIQPSGVWFGSITKHEGAVRQSCCAKIPGGFWRKSFFNREETFREVLRKWKFWTTVVFTVLLYSKHRVDCLLQIICSEDMGNYRFIFKIFWAASNKLKKLHSEIPNA